MAEQPLVYLGMRSSSHPLHRLHAPRGVAMGGISVIYPQNQSTLQIFMWPLVVVFFSLTQDKFDIVPVCALARVSFTYLRTTIYTPLK